MKASSFSPYVLVNKLLPLPHMSGCLRALKLEEVGEWGDELIEQQLLAWKDSFAEAKIRLDNNGKQMVHNYRRRRGSDKIDVHFCFEARDRVLCKERVTQKLETKCQDPYEFLRNHNM